MPVALGSLIATIFPRIYARTYYAHPRARVMSFSNAALELRNIDFCGAHQEVRGCQARRFKSTKVPKFQEQKAPSIDLGMTIK